MTDICPLCQFSLTKLFYRDEERSYIRCPRCSLIFVSRNDLLSMKEEKARYDLHENSPDNEGYQEFLAAFINPLIHRVGPPPQKGLDFGSGPGPVLATMLKTKGYQMDLYDPYFAPNPKSLHQSFDFVTCTETIEHFYEPYQEWQLMLDLIKPGGWLGIMTQLVQERNHFPDMHYITDMTHVSFFSRETFLFLANKQKDLHVEFEGDNRIFIQQQMPKL